jgi:hypothetical protein
MVGMLCGAAACGDDGSAPAEREDVRDGSVTEAEAMLPSDASMMRSDGATTRSDGGPVSDAGSPSDAAAGDTWESYAQGFFETYCVECHNRGGATNRDYEMLSIVRDQASRIRCGVSPDELEGCGPGFPSPSQFPIGAGPFPSDDERRRIVAWLDNGAL